MSLWHKTRWLQQGKDLTSTGLHSGEVQPQQCDDQPLPCSGGQVRLPELPPCEGPARQGEHQGVRPLLLQQAGLLGILLQRLAVHQARGQLVSFILYFSTPCSSLQVYCVPTDLLSAGSSSMAVVLLYVKPPFSQPCVGKKTE